MGFEKLYHRYYNEIYQFAYQLSLSQTEAKDLLQDAFLLLFNELNREVEIENPRAWLYKVVLNLWRNKYNKTKKHQLNNTLYNNQNNSSPSPEVNFLNKEKRELVSNCMAQLPTKDRDILFLYHDGLSYAEIAEVLDMKATSVGTTLSRSIKKLKLILKTKHHELFEQN